MRSRVYVTRRIFDEAIVFLAGQVEVVGNATDRVLDPGELRDALPAMDGVPCLLTDRIDAPLMDFCSNLRVVANFAVGCNNIDLPAATKRGILVTNTPGVLTETTADFAWCLLMAAARRVAEADRTRLRMCMMAAENLLAGLRGERPENLVNTDVWDRPRRQPRSSHVP